MPKRFSWVHGGWVSEQHHLLALHASYFLDPQSLSGGLAVFQNSSALKLQAQQNIKQLERPKPRNCTSQRSEKTSRAGFTDGAREIRPERPGASRRELRGAARLPPLAAPPRDATGGHVTAARARLRRAFPAALQARRPKRKTARRLRLATEVGVGAKPTRGHGEVKPLVVPTRGEGDGPRRLTPTAAPPGRPCSPGLRGAAAGSREAGRGWTPLGRRGRGSGA